MRFTLSCVGVFCMASVAGAFPPSESFVTTRVYDLKPLVESYARVEKPWNVSTTAEVLQTLTREGNQSRILEMVELEGPRLEIKATLGAHQVIPRFLSDLKRDPRFVIRMDTQLVEFDAAEFDKKVLPRFRLADERVARAVVAVDQDAAHAVLKAGKRIHESEDKHLDGTTAVISARQSIIPKRTAEPDDASFSVHGIEKVGYQLQATINVSLDHRHVFLKLVEECREVEQRSMTRDGFRFNRDGPEPVEPVPAHRPVEFGKKANVEIKDGEAALFRLDYAPKNRVWVVILQPVILPVEREKK